MSKPEMTIEPKPKKKYRRGPRCAWNHLRVKSEMFSQQITNIDLAKSASLSISTICKFLKGEEQSEKTAKLISFALGISLDCLRMPTEDGKDSSHDG